MNARRSVLDFLARSIAVPSYNWRWGIRNRHLRARLLETQYLDPGLIRERQFAALQSLLHHAYAQTRFYRSRFDSLDAVPSDIKTWTDFSALPPLTKEDLRTHTKALLSESANVSRLRQKRTGGSTGVPVRVYWDQDAVNFKHAVVQRHDGWTGYRAGDKRAALWGDTDKQYHWKERIYKVLAERTIYLDTLDMSERQMSSFVQKCRRSRPRWLIGHAHSLYFFCQFLRDKLISDLSFKGIISTAETLSKEERRYIESTFGKVLFDRYGCEEVSLVASECEAHQGLHVSAEGVIVEVLDSDGGEPGRLILTDLSNRAMPLIRYEVGDLASWLPGRCDCGRGLPRLTSIHGRTSDVLYTPEGVRISGISILDTFFIHIAGVKQAQIIQRHLDHVLFKVVRSDHFSQATHGEIAQAVRDIFGPSMRYSLEFVDEIPRTPRGKFQFTVCEVDSKPIA